MTNIGQQYSLWLGLEKEIPAARTTDPDTSHIAQTQMRETGKLSARRAQVLLLVSRHPLHTSGELGELMEQYHPDIGLSASPTPHKRLPELRKLGLVRSQDKRVCRVSGHQSMTWECTPAGLLAIATLKEASK